MDHFLLMRIAGIALKTMLPGAAWAALRHECILTTQMCNGWSAAGSLVKPARPIQPGIKDARLGARGRIARSIVHGPGGCGNLGKRRWTKDEGKRDFTYQPFITISHSPPGRIASAGASSAG